MHQPQESFPDVDPFILILEAAIDRCDTKREVAEAVGRDASILNSIIYHDRSLRPRWQALPADGAFAGRFSGMPRAIERQVELDGLVAEAVADLDAAGNPICSENPQNHDAIRLLLAMYAITGSMNFKRGWVRSTMVALTDGRGTMPSAKVMRWYKSNLVSDPMRAMEVPGVNPDLLNDLMEQTGQV